MIDDFLAHLQFRHFADKTLRRRCTTLRRFERFLVPRPIVNATSADVEEFLSMHHAPATRHAYRSDLRTFYAWAVTRGLLESSPAATIESVKVPKCLPRPIAPELALAALTYGPRVTRQMVGCALFAGLRCCEVAALRGENVQTSIPLLVVRNGKGGKDRSVPMHPMLVDLLDDVPASGLVFPNPRNGRQMLADTISSRITKHLRRGGINARPHQLRHTFGTELARASGGNMVLTAALMGHDSMSTTMGYVRLTSTHAVPVVSMMYAGSEAA